MGTDASWALPYMQSVLYSCSSVLEFAQITYHSIHVHKQLVSLSKKIENANVFNRHLTYFRLKLFHRFGIDVRVGGSGLFRLSDAAVNDFDPNSPHAQSKNQANTLIALKRVPLLANVVDQIDPKSSWSVDETALVLPLPSGE